MFDIWSKSDWLKAEDEILETADGWCARMRAFQ